jgi:hypothetical protein
MNTDMSPHRHARPGVGGERHRVARVDASEVTGYGLSCFGSDLHAIDHGVGVLPALRIAAAVRFDQLQGKADRAVRTLQPRRYHEVVAAFQEGPEGELLQAVEVGLPRRIALVALCPRLEAEAGVILPGGHLLVGQAQHPAVDGRTARQARADDVVHRGVQRTERHRRVAHLIAATCTQRGQITDDVCPR